MVLEPPPPTSPLFNENLPLLELVDSDWTMFNSRLAIHYGVAGPHLRGVTRVTLGPETGRGGMLTHASILLLTSDGTRHRPAHRGALAYHRAGTGRGRRRSAGRRVRQTAGWSQLCEPGRIQKLLPGDERLAKAFLE